ncbi:ubiquitin carboxyl-terminal hydrolase 20-like [Amphiura filiformis]|uniref:ubiquitin carboxyl-terminal hydrolase 20-like n=1 Tax=Amphiura filiformis TaxID=82378 RepID=UPI003B211953
MGRNKPCEHLSNAGTFHERELRERAKGTCDACDAPGPNLWLCLEADCGYVGCGESAKDHSTEHTQSTSHQLTLNLYTLRVWCYECEIEVFPDSVMREMDDQQMLMRQRMVMEREAERIVQRESKWEMPPRLPTLARIDSPVTQAMDEFLNDDPKPRGLTGLRNLGNTCYMNAGIQALSNCPPFTHFFLECPGYVKTEKKPYLAKTYQKLMEEIWGKRRPSYLTPSSLINTIKTVFPMFKGFTQQDTQEFLRCFMDRLHEELKEPIVAGETEEEDDEDEASEPQQVEHPHRTRSHDSLCQSDGEQSIPDNDEVASQTSDGERLPNKNRRLRKRAAAEADQISSSSETTVTQEERGSISKSEQDMQNSEKDIDESETVQYNESMEEGSVEVEDTREQPDRRARKSSHSKMTRSPSHEDVSTRTAGRRQHSKFRSIVSDVFDGKILSSVQCLTCDLVSTRKETFQDLSLPIPGKEDLARIHASQGMPSKSGVPCSDTYGRQGWFSWIYSWVTGWFWGPSVTLDDCLAAFFSADDLKGDNMYSCDKCKKLRNGVKFSQVVDLPEILCIHLKRFRHESLTSYSSKIGSYVAFPMEGLDMSPYLVNKGNTDKVTTYDLASVICHHGTAGGGHYTAYAQNWLNGQWYEYDDVYVTEVSDMQVANCEAYVLFYRKVSDEAIRERQRVSDMCEQQEPSLLHFYVSLEWLNKFNTFAEPGPISNNDFLCKHGGVPPSKASYVDQLVVKVPQPVWQYIHDRYGGGPAVNHLYACATCQAEMEQLEKRRREEMQTFIKLNDEFQADDSPSSVIYCISLSWFKQWEAFVKAKLRDPPGPIDNRPISITKGGHATLRHGADSGQISEDMWQYLHSIYDGGPEIVLRPNRPVIPEHFTNHSSSAEEDMDTSNTGSRDDQNRV